MEGESEISPVAPEIVDRVKESFNRAVAQNPQFFEDFYESLFAKSDVYEQMFGQTDMIHQYARLYNGINKLFEFAANPDPVQLHMVSTIHSRSHVDVNPAHYLDWVDTLLEMLTLSDPQFDSHLAGDWVTVVTPGIDHMKSKH